MRYLYIHEGGLEQREFNVDDDIPQDDLLAVDKGLLDIVALREGRFEKITVDSVVDEGEDDTGDDLTKPEATVEYSVDGWDPIPMPS